MLKALQSFVGVLFAYVTVVLTTLRRIAEGGASSKQEERKEWQDPQPPSESPYSDEYETIIRQGHTRPIPEVGAPALLWHVGIWPRRRVRRSRELCDPHDTHNMTYEKARGEYLRRRDLWVDQVNTLVRKLQEADCRPRAGQSPKQFISSVPHELPTRQPGGPGADDSDEPTKILQNETIGFTVWWKEQDQGTKGDPPETAIRVRIHVELNADYAAFSFYMDLGQPWDRARLADGDNKPGKRRHDAFEAVADIKRICEAQLKRIDPAKTPAAVDWPLLPERLVRPDTRDAAQLDAALMAARDLLYVDLWEVFARDFKCSLEAIAGDRGEVFANFRGLVLATVGIPAAAPAYADHAKDGLMGSLGTQDFPTFDTKAAEPNAVLKAFWPFVRRVTIDADYRDFVACGIMDWRALYVTALGASSQYEENAERRPAVHNRSERDLVARDTQIKPRASSTDKYNHPVRTLFLIKHDAHPRQLGRMVERINTMGTLRLFALKDWSAIKDADPVIRMLGQELDQKMKNWSEKRKAIYDWKTFKDFRAALQKAREQEEEENESDFRELLDVKVPGRVESFVRWFWASAGGLALWRYRSIIHEEANNRRQDMRFEALYQVTKRIESSLIGISTRLDAVGAKCVGGLHFRLYRSAFYVKEFDMLLETLRVGNVATWVGYDRFVQRGLQPTFDFISDVGVRLRALRNRLQSVMDAIETSALVVQSEATRKNTAALRRIVIVGVLGLIAFTANAFKVPDIVKSIPLPKGFKVPEEIWHQILAWLQFIWEWLVQVFS